MDYRMNFSNSIRKTLTQLIATKAKSKMVFDDYLQIFRKTRNIYRSQCKSLVRNIQDQSKSRPLTAWEKHAQSGLYTACALLFQKHEPKAKRPPPKAAFTHLLQRFSLLLLGVNLFQPFTLHSAVMGETFWALNAVNYS